MAAAGSLLLGVGGAALGAPFGLGALGFSIGSSLGAYLFAPDLPTVEGPRLNDLRVMSSAYGAPIPRVYGSMRVAGQMIWSDGIKEHRQETTIGGKGGPEQTQVSYTYTASFAVALCAGPVSGVSDIKGDAVSITTDWALIDASTAPGLAGKGMHLLASSLGQNVRAYLGTEDQDPDPLIESIEGVGDTPAYRGLCYLVFEDLPLAKFGNRIPNITATVASQSATTWIGDRGETVPQPYDDAGRVHGAFLPSVDDFFCFVGQNDTTYTDFSVKFYRLMSGTPVEVALNMPYVSITNQPMSPGVSDAIPMYVACKSSGNRSYVCGYYEEQLNRVLEFEIDAGEFLGYYYMKWLQTGDHFYMAHSNPSVSSNTVRRARFQPHPSPGSPVVAESPDFSALVMDMKLGRDGAIYLLCDDGTVKQVDAPGLTTVTTIATGIPSVNEFSLIEPVDATEFRCITASAYYVWRNGALTKITDLSAITFIGSASGWNISWNCKNAVLTDEKMIVFNSSSADFKNRLVIAERVTSGAGDQLDQIVLATCRSAGMSAADVDVTDLSGITVEGLLVDRPSSPRQVLEALMRAYHFDAVETGGVLKFIRRASAATVSVPEDDLASEVERDRTENTGLPLVVSIRYAGGAPDYNSATQHARRVSR